VARGPSPESLATDGEAGGSGSQGTSEVVCQGLEVEMGLPLEP
jgi:hypothetical protein